MGGTVDPPQADRPWTDAQPRPTSLRDVNRATQTMARTYAAISLLILVPLGFGLKFYPGPGHAWVNNSLGGTAYVIFWCLAWFVAWPRRSAINPIVIGVLVVTCMLEAMQLLDHPVLARIRGTFLGRTLIGTTFVWSDYLYYVIGAVLGRLWLGALCRLERRAPDAPTDRPDA